MQSRILNVKCSGSELITPRKLKPAQKESSGSDESKQCPSIPWLYLLNGAARWINSATHLEWAVKKRPLVVETLAV